MYNITKSIGNPTFLIDEEKIDRPINISMPGRSDHFYRRLIKTHPRLFDHIRLFKKCLSSLYLFIYYVTLQLARLSHVMESLFCVHRWCISVRN